MRFFKISKVLANYFILNNFNSNKKKSLGLRIRESCEELGPTFVKLGQLLSLRYDILLEKDARELQKLFDSVKPFPYEIAREIIKKDLRNYPEELFFKFDKNPIASASISQVYRAKLQDGRKVAVKVRRPFIGKEIQKDMNILRKIMKVSQIISPTMKRMQIANVMGELGKTLQKEIDFRNEFENIEIMQEHMGHYRFKKVRRDLGHIFIPQVYKQLSSKNVLTMDFIKGIPMTRFRKVIENPQYDVKKSIKTAICGGVRGMFEDKEYVFHGDPHPANLILMEEGNIGLLDFGIVGKFSQEQNKKAGDLFLAVYTQNIDATIEAALNLAEVHDRSLGSNIRKDMKQYLNKTKSAGIGFWFFDIAKIFIKYNIRFPLYLTLFGRANMIFDGLIHSIDPENMALDYVGKELRRGVIKNTFRNITGTNYLAIIYNLSKKLKESPEKINHFINETYDRFLS